MTPRNDGSDSVPIRHFLRQHQVAESGVAISFEPLPDATLEPSVVLAHCDIRCTIGHAVCNIFVVIDANSCLLNLIPLLARVE